MSHLNNEKQHHGHGRELELFVHRYGAKPEVLVASSGDTVREVLIRIGVIEEGQDDILVFVGECELALQESEAIDDGTDEHSPVDISLTLEVLEIEKHRHVHVHRCKHIEAQVNFNGRTKQRRFSPATTILVVTQWARKQFQLDPAAAAEYVLQICGSVEQPRSDEHLGELVDETTCSICFDFVREVTPQG